MRGLVGATLLLVALTSCTAVRKLPIVIRPESVPQTTGAQILEHSSKQSAPGSADAPTATLENPPVAASRRSYPDSAAGAAERIGAAPETPPAESTGPTPERRAPDVVDPSPSGARAHHFAPRPERVDSAPTPDIDEWTDRGFARAAVGDWVGAGNSFREAQRLAEESADARRPGRLSPGRLGDEIRRCSTRLLYDGIREYRRGDLEAAIEVWEQIQAFDPSFREARKNVETASEQLRNLEQLELRPAISQQ